MEEATRQDDTQCATSTAAGASNKLFLGGLSWTTTEDTIQSHFSKYGELLEVIVMRDRVTNKPRGFGFVTFKEQEAADKAFQDEHVLDGRTIDAKPSLPHGEHSSPKSKKIFVGGLAPETTEELFREHFEKYGKVVEAQIMVDHNSGRSRGFGFITFAEESSVAAVFNGGSMQEIGGKRVEVKAATPKGSGPVGRGAGMSIMAAGGGRGAGSMGAYAYAGAGGGRGGGMMGGGRYPGDYGGWAMHPAYMMSGAYGGYIPYGYPSMMMGGMGYPAMQYGGMGYPMQQQAVPGVVPGSMQRQQQQGSAAYGGYGSSGSSGAQAAEPRGGGAAAGAASGSRAASEGQAAAAGGSSSRAARRQQQQQSKNEGSAEGVKLPDNLNPTTAGEQQQQAAGTPAATTTTASS